MSNPIKLDAVIRAAGPALTFDSGGVCIGTWLSTLKGVRASRTTLNKTNGGAFNTADVDDQSVELLSDLSLTLFQRLRRDRLGGFVAAHPDWVATSSS